MEYKSIKPELYNKINHKHFNKIFTIEKKLVDKKKYFFYNSLNVIPSKIKFLKKKKKYSKCIFFTNKPNEDDEYY